VGILFLVQFPLNILFLVQIDIDVAVITDDLIVMPNCIEYASFGLLQKLGIKDPISVKEMNLNVTKEKVLYLNFYSMFLFILNEKC
jgi:hypothetical protein